MLTLLQVLTMGPITLAPTPDSTVYHQTNQRAPGLPKSTIWTSGLEWTLGRQLKLLELLLKDCKALITGWNRTICLTAMMGWTSRPMLRYYDTDICHVCILLRAIHMASILTLKWLSSISFFPLGTRQYPWQKKQFKTATELGSQLLLIS